VPATDAGAPPTGLSGLLYNKWYVDELYDRIVVRPLLGLSRFCWRVLDHGIVDGLVNGVGNAARALGWVGSLFQTGSVNTYALILTIGVLAILGYVVL
jgi:NADH-quinone oxidoreductase subunit L